MTPEEFARWRGVDERFIKLAVAALNGERQPIDPVTDRLRFDHLVSEWREYRAATAVTVDTPRAE